MVLAETGNKLGDCGVEWTAWLDEYFERFAPAFARENHTNLVAFKELAEGIRDSGKKMMLAGNGASASIASHGAVDFAKQAKVRSIDFNEPNFITAYANDYGYENWIARAIECHGDDGDAVVLISASGMSPNVVNAAEYARERGLALVTFSGKSADNALRQLGDINFWMDSQAYNVVEAVHMLWLTTVIDMIVGRAEYSVN
jgi:D-sedoheptulose 7-phosphate isomerase